jgi:hypothetical protein
VKLPYDPAGPLPIIPEWIINTLIILALSALAAVIIYYWLKNRSRVTVSSDQPAADKGMPTSEIIHEYYEQYLESGMYRPALHSLSCVLKTHCEKLSGTQVEEMSLSEMRKVITDKEMIGLFNDLVPSQFGREKPQKSEFIAIYKRAMTITGKNKKIRIQKGEAG